LQPIKVELEKGKQYAWCSCGASERQPFCDGSHKHLNAELKEGEPKFMPIRFTCVESGNLFLCMCKATKKRPFCDGTHKSLMQKQ